MTNKELEKMLIKLDAVLSLMQDIYEVLAKEAIRVEVEEDAPSDSL